MIINHTRRQFMRHSLGALLGTTLGATGTNAVLGNLCRTLAAAGNATSTWQANDYKALVCIYLSGGNDGDNTLIGRGNSEYANYVRGRNNLAIPRETLLPIAPATSDGREWGLHPGMVALHPLFAQKKLALLANVGMLTTPLTRAQYLAGQTPPLLFSHTDQAHFWQTSWPDRHDARTGWGGRLADLMNVLNTNAQLSLSVSVAGSNLFQAAENVTQYQIAPEGSVGLLDYDESDNADPITKGVREILALEHANLFERAYRDLTKRANDNNLKLNAALASSPPLTTQFPMTKLGQQLRMVAQLIGVRKALGMRRQVFYCDIEGFDTHGAQLEVHAELLQTLSRALAAFYQATVELNVASQVTTFTTSEFGRTWHANGSGSDHGWGGHQLIMGGAVRGGDIYGKVPVQVEEGPDDSGEGRWIPTTSVDEYAATMARWFGVSAGDLPLVVPNIERFAKPDLGFLTS